MKTTIITATYNSSATITSAIESVLEQDYPNIEHLIVDGASKDKTVEIVKSFQEEHAQIVLHSAPDKGIYDALNKGVSMATGDIIGFLHSDDFFADPQILSKVMQVMSDDQVDGVFGDLKYVSAGDESKVIRYWKSRPFRSTLLKHGWMPAHPTLFLKKEVYEKHGNFDLDFRIAADYDFMLRILSDPNLKFTYLPEVITHMRVGGASNAVGNIKQKMKEDLKALRKNNLPRPYLTLLRKNLSKIPQFLKK
ncbi:MAG: glycosyltransferase family 2 protein [Brumimicrobium sp.]|nr:glycosyltransferase family 2 protein [Brumimicrobium sp.]